MNRLKSILLFILVLMLSGSLAIGQTSKRNSVSVTCSCDDQMGREYADALRKALANSPHYREVGYQEGFEQSAIRISIVSLPLSENAAGKSRSALSIVCLHEGVILHQFVETCNNIPIEDCAKSILTSLLDWAKA